MTVEDDIGLLERTPTLSLLGRQALRILAIGAETRYIHNGALLFRAGDEAEGAFVVQAGRFSLAASTDGNSVTVGPCTLLGELALFTETRRPATARALEPSTVLCIPRQLFVRMLDSFPDAARKLQEILAARLDEFRARHVQPARGPRRPRAEAGARTGDRAVVVDTTCRRPERNAANPCLPESAVMGPRLRGNDQSYVDPIRLTPRASPSPGRGRRAATSRANVCAPAGR